jgi:hypothetical protein
VTQQWGGESDHLLNPLQTAGEMGLPGHLSPLQLVFVGHAAIEAAAPDSGVVIYTNLVSIEFRTRPVTDRARPTS